LAPLLRYGPGCIVCYLLAVDDGEVATIGIFADRASAAAASRQATMWIETELIELIEGPADLSLGAVTVH
jgi:hypothetical protein